ncbi:MAG: hypothetical protein NDF55_10700 [archaeon GB-1867-005]|nr:hypothetical protein [Candidatus Culexmicrobium cathedralense]
MELKTFIEKNCEKCPYRENCSALCYKDEPYHWDRLVYECPAVENFIKELIEKKEVEKWRKHVKTIIDVITG